VLEVPVAMMNGTAAAMRSSRLRGRMRMAGAWTMKTTRRDELELSPSAMGGTQRFFGKLGPTSLFAVNGS
jgi:hypothetical protein